MKLQREGFTLENDTQTHTQWQAKRQQQQKKVTRQSSLPIRRTAHVTLIASRTVRKRKQKCVRVCVRLPDALMLRCSAFAVRWLDPRQCYRRQTHWVIDANDAKQKMILFFPASKLCLAARMCLPCHVQQSETVATGSIPLSQPNLSQWDCFLFFLFSSGSLKIHLTLGREVLQMCKKSAKKKRKKANSSCRVNYDLCCRCLLPVRSLSTVPIREPAERLYRFNYCFFHKRAKNKFQAKHTSGSNGHSVLCTLVK